MDLPKWSLADLRTRYALEPELNDCFVEGAYDRDVLSTAYDHSTRQRRPLYIADVLDIKQPCFDKHSLTWGNKQKLLILARELAGESGGDNVRVIVDRDTDHWIGPLEQTERLVWTEFCDIETYFFEEGLVRHVIENGGRAKIPDWDAFYSSFVSTLKSLFSIRVTSSHLKLNVDYIKYDKVIKVGAGCIQFDCAEYINRLLMNSGLTKKKTEFIDSQKYWENTISGDPRLFCRGHDFVYLLAWCVSKYKGVHFTDHEAMERVLVMLTPQKFDAFDGLL